MSHNDRVHYLLFLSLLPFLIAPVVSLLKTSECASNSFSCGNGECVSVLFLCDGEADCTNGADERCNGTQHHTNRLDCGEGRFTCPGLDMCLPNKWKCDGHKDCPDGSDEKNCTEEQKCEGFRCKTGECIPKKWQCDNNFDCSDGSDEENCKASKLNSTCIRENGYFECASGKCISHEKVCNGHKDCPGGDDEGKLCNIDGCHSKNCTHGCFETPEGPQCNCLSGYKLRSDKRTCADIDECVQSDGNVCSHNCVNLKGSFKCSCEDGFKLVNNTRCVVKSAEPVLIYTDSHSVRGYWMYKKTHFLIARALSAATGVDMHRESKLVFWTDIGNSSYVFSAHFDNKDVKAIVTSGLSKPEDIAVDYVANNLYITDSDLKQIIVCRMDGSTCAPIIRHGLDNVRAIVLDVENGRMFWTDWGHEPGVYMARMDGTNIQALVNRSIVWPNGLTYDKYKNRIYWSDARLERIEYYDLKHGRRFVLIDDAVYHPHCLTMFEDDLYWADWEQFSVSKSNKFTGHNVTSLFRKTNSIFGMHIYHPVHYMTSINPCWSASCSHLCLIRSASEFRCACPNNMKLDLNDPTTCIERNESTYLLVGLEETVKQIWPDNIAKDISMKLVKKIPQEFDHISQYTIKHRKGDKSGELFLSSINKPGIARFEIETQNYSMIYPKNASSLFELTYDPFSDNLYWLDTENGHLVVASADGKKQVTLMDDLKHPSALELYQERNELFIGLMGDHPIIMAADLNGRNRKVVINNLGMPTSLTICKTHDILYWSDAKKGTIESVSLNDINSRTVVLSGLGQVESLIIKEQMLYWTKMDTSYLYMMNLLDKKKKVKIASIGAHSSNSKKLMIAHKTLTTNDCLTMKNKCSDICLFNGFKTINNVKVPLTQCVCPSGSRLSEDQHTCVTRQHCPEGYFTCHSTKTCIRTSEVCDGHKNCPNNEDEIGCPEVAPCSQFESRCDPKDLKSSCIPNSWFCDGENDCENGLDELNCHNHSAKSIYADVAHKSTINDQCEKGYFKCDNNTCIPWHFVCNGELNCLDKSDEGADCLNKCACKNNGKCFLNNDKVWSCQCPPQFEGFDCDIPVDLTSRSDEDHSIVMKQSIYTKGRYSNGEDDSSFVDDGNSFWMIMLIVVMVLLVIGLVVSSYIYMYESDGRMYTIRRNMNRKLNFRHNSLKKTYGFSSATADLLNEMEEPEDDDPKSLNQQVC